MSLEFRVNGLAEDLNLVGGSLEMMVKTIKGMSIDKEAQRLCPGPFHP